MPVDMNIVSILRRKRTDLKYALNEQKQNNQSLVVYIQNGPMRENWRNKCLYVLLICFIFLCKTIAYKLVDAT